jgi:hypothetical protein
MEQDSLKKFWELLETDFPLGGPRHYLVDQLAADLVQQLETLGGLCYQRVADTYPCLGPMDIGCPRAVIHLGDGRYSAVCGNKPELCRELELTTEDVSFLSVDMIGLCRAVAQALRIGGTAEKLGTPRHTYRAGTFVPESGIKYPVYLVAHCAKRDYAEAFHALRSQALSPTFAILVPTYNHLADEETRYQMGKIGIPVLALDGVLDIQNGQLVSSVDPLSYFGGLGYRNSVLVPITGGTTAEALVCNGHERAEWLKLSESAYKELAAEASEYEIFADELTGMVVRNSNGQHQQPKHLQASYFQFLRTCIDHRHRGYYDPGVSPPGYEDGKQLFVRARKAVDVRFQRPDGKEDWRLFKTRYVEKAAHYEFSPEPGTSFALIFKPRS